MVINHIVFFAEYQPAVLESHRSSQEGRRVGTPLHLPLDPTLSKILALDLPQANPMSLRVE